MNEIRDRVHLLLRIRTVADRSKPDRLDEVDQVRWDRHAHDMASSLQLETDGGAGLDVAASSMGGQYDLHRNLDYVWFIWTPELLHPHQHRRTTRLKTDFIALRYRVTESLAIGLLGRFTHIDTSSKRRIIEK